MKKLSASVLLLALLLLTGCEKRLFHFVATVEEAPVFPVDQTGAFRQTVRVTREDVMSRLNLPTDARITGVDIESLALRVVVKSGNQASTVQATGTIADAAEPVPKPMFENYPVVLAGADTPFIGLNALIESGISKLRSKLDGFIKDLDNAPFDIQVSGDSIPSGQRVVVELHLAIKATIKYDQCVEVPTVFSSGDDCNL
jgi:hypothetical protein